MGRKMALGPEARAAAVRLLAAGGTLSAVARQLKCSRTAVRNSRLLEAGGRTLPSESHSLAPGERRLERAERCGGCGGCIQISPCRLCDVRRQKAADRAAEILAASEKRGPRDPRHGFTNPLRKTA